MSAGQQLAHRIPLLLVKAGFSALPLAVFAFDVIREVVDFGNAQLTDRFLESVGARVEQLEESERERLKADKVYQQSGRAALQRLLTETNPQMADALARAVAALGVSSLPTSERMEIARSLDVLNEPILHLLQTLYRVQHDLLTPREIELAGKAKTHEGFTQLLTRSMPLLSWILPVNELHRSGMVEAIESDGYFKGNQAFAEPGETRVVPLSPVFPLGDQVVRMCFDDLTRPAFGLFADA